MIERRSFLKLGILGLLPVISPILSKAAVPAPVVNFAEDGPGYSPETYVAKLQEILRTTGIKPDQYGKGGAVEQLEQRIAAITGKEAACYLPTGTLANQLALSLLSGENTKVYLPETSHIYRDEADAAQSVYGKRLIPLAKGEPCFSAGQLQDAIKYDHLNEVFKSGIGAVAIENPVRRADGVYIPYAELQQISAYCKSNRIPLHLDGARLYLASAYSGVSIADYAGLGDTVYISLYKYMGAAGGAVLAGSKAVISRLDHYIKVHGGTIYQSWANAAMALYHLDGLADRMKQTRIKSDELHRQLVASGFNMVQLKNGTNISHLLPGKEFDGQKFSSNLRKQGVLIRNPNPLGIILVQINESLIPVDVKTLVQQFMEARHAAVS